MKLLYPTVMNELSAQITDFSDLENWRSKQLLTYLAPVIMSAAKLNDSNQAMNLLLAAEGLANDHELSLRLGISPEIISEARSADHFWDFALTYYPYFEPLYINCLTTQDALLRWASMR